MTLSPASRPRLASKARLRLDRRTGNYFLLYPERGLQLNATATEIVRLCTGEHTVASIVAQLAEKYPAQDRGALEREVIAFLTQIGSRGLLETTATVTS